MRDLILVELLAHLATVVAAMVRISVLIFGNAMPPSLSGSSACSSLSQARRPLPALFPHTNDLMNLCSSSITESMGQE
jgi:hypothetical protein